MREAPRAEFALVDPPALTKGVFRPLPKAAVRQKLDVEMTFGGTRLRWRGPDQLGAVEQSVLLGALALAGQVGLELHTAPNTPLGARLRSALEAAGPAAEAPAILMQTSWSALARASGIGRGGADLALVREALARLAEVTVWLGDGEQLASTRLLAYLASDERGVAVALNFRLARAVLGGQHVYVNLEERRALKGDTARILHGALCSMLREQRAVRFTLVSLEAAVFGSVCAGSTGRDRRRRVLAALGEIGALPGWSVQWVRVGSRVVGATIGRGGRRRRSTTDASGSSRRVKSPTEAREIAVAAT